MLKNRPPRAFLIAFLLGTSACRSALVYPSAPAGDEDIARSFVRPLAAQPLPEDFTLAPPYLAYGINLDDLRTGRMLANPTPYAREYIIVHDSEAIGSVDWEPDPKLKKSLRFRALAQNGSCGDVLKALQIARDLRAVRRHDYEVRKLGIAPLLFEAVWLHGQSDDILIPIGKTFDRWQELHPYPEQELTKLLQAELKKTMEESERENRIPPNFYATVDRSKFHPIPVASLSASDIGRNVLIETNFPVSETMRRVPMRNTAVADKKHVVITGRLEAFDDTTISLSTPLPIAPDPNQRVRFDRIPKQEYVATLLIDGPVEAPTPAKN